MVPATTVATARARFGSQGQTIDQGAIAKVLGIPMEKVEIETLLAGGSFGRRAQATAHLAAELAEVAKAMPVGTPVKLVWTREDDIHGGYYRPLFVHRFRGTVKDNIRMGLPTASFEDVVRAARMAGADEFIQLLPHRYDTELEEGAVNLSGGQKQRLSIARALLRQPRVIIFDEATSALDPESEAIVVKNLKEIARGRTAIVISHRLATIRDSDAIIVFDNGAINDVGRHDELLARNFVYHQLWTQQARTA